MNILRNDIYIAHHDHPHNNAAAAASLAVKAIDKAKLTDLLALRRVHAEIAALQDPALQHHASMLNLKDVVHTPKYIYLVTERGGKDLFDYLGPLDRASCIVSG